MAKKIHKGVAYNPVADGVGLSVLYYYAGKKRIYVTPEQAEELQQEDAPDAPETTAPEENEE